MVIMRMRKEVDARIDGGDEDDKCSVDILICS